MDDNHKGVASHPFPGLACSPLWSRHCRARQGRVGDYRERWGLVAENPQAVGPWPGKTRERDGRRRRRTVRFCGNYPGRRRDGSPGGGGSRWVLAAKHIRLLCKLDGGTEFRHVAQSGQRDRYDGGTADNRWRHAGPQSSGTDTLAAQLPAFLLAQFGDVRGVVASMPGVEKQ